VSLRHFAFLTSFENFSICIFQSPTFLRWCEVFSKKTGLCIDCRGVVVVVVVVVGECEPILEVSLVAETECGPEAGGYVSMFFSSQKFKQSIEQ
jgi:hypothetical protein